MNLSNHQRFASVAITRESSSAAVVIRRPWRHAATTPAERTATVWTLLEQANLTPRERTVVMLRFGLDGSHEWRTLAEVARHLECSREYCRQVVQRALRKLRKTGIECGWVEA